MRLSSCTAARFRPAGSVIARDVAAPVPPAAISSPAAASRRSRTSLRLGVAARRCVRTVIQPYDRTVVLRPRLLGAMAVLSLLTMPLTAVWFLWLGSLLLMASAIVASTRRDLDAQASALGTGVSVAAGLLVGTVVYLLLALLSA